MKKTLVAYFSASGVTAEAAKKLAKAAGADLYEIKPAVPYTDKDLDWRNEQSRSSVEMRSKGSRDNNADISQYDTIYLGFPIWWYVAPTIINSFLESYDFSGKTIILFATSGGSGFGSTAKNLKSSVASDTNIIEGKINNMSDESLRTWIESLNI